MGALLLDRAAFMCNSFLQLFLDFNKGQVWSPNRQMQYKSLTIAGEVQSKDKNWPNWQPSTGIIF